VVDEEDESCREGALWRHGLTAFQVLHLSLVASGSIRSVLLRTVPGLLPCDPAIAWRRPPSFAWDARITLPPGLRLSVQDEYVRIVVNRLSS
jgi:hypothetical protein